MTTSSPPSLRIAIVGGGLAGASLANSLTRVSHLDVHVYESAAEFSERGAAVGLSTNAQKALQHVVPSAVDLLKRAGTVHMNSSRFVLGSGPAAGSVIMDLAGSDPGNIVHRASLLRELLAPLPKDILHANKKLTSIQHLEDGVEVTFADGVVERFDAVIGADGIFGAVRKHVLQDAAKECEATPGGFWDCRNLVPYEKAKAVLGEEYFEVDRQYGWSGDGGFIMHDILENRTMVQCVMSGVERDPPKDRKRPLTREFLENAFSSWLDGPIAKGIIDLCLDSDHLFAYSQWEHKSTPTFTNGRVCIMGDAAHATTPWQGSGAGQAIEDAMVLGSLLGAITSAQEIVNAFKAYDAVRRPRTQRVIDSSRGTGNIICGQDKEAGLDPDKLRDTLAPRWNFIMSLDMAQHQQEALDKLKELQAK